MIETKDEIDDDPTDSDCPWCGNVLYQGMEMRYCSECPFSAMYSSDLSNAPPYIVEAYAEYASDQWEQCKHE
jgi:predicted nucleic-acid-binding Zn-ribbon protein